MCGTDDQLYMNIALYIFAGKDGSYQTAVL
jgi:hypothetical protein